MANLYIIAGPNGAGKTVAAYTIKKAKELNYFVVLVYLWLNSRDLAVERVKARVKER